MSKFFFFFVSAYLCACVNTCAYTSSPCLSFSCNYDSTCSYLGLSCLASLDPLNMLFTASYLYILSFLFASYQWILSYLFVSITLYYPLPHFLTLYRISSQVYSEDEYDKGGCGRPTKHPIRHLDQSVKSDGELVRGYQKHCADHGSRL